MQQSGNGAQDCMAAGVMWADHIKTLGKLNCNSQEQVHDQQCGRGPPHDIGSANLLL